MLKRKFVSYSVFVFLALLIGANTVSACTCIWRGMPQCARFSRADAVFVGRISSIQKPSKKQVEKAEGPLQQFIYFDVEHPLKNANSKKIRASTDYKNSCAYEDEDIVVGQQWLVFAEKDNEGNLRFGKCGGSYKIDNKDELKEVLAELPPTKNKQQLFLDVIEFGGFKALEEVKAFTEINGQKIEAVRTGSLLTFEVPKAGKYKIQITLPYKSELGDVYEGGVIKNSVSETESVFETEMEVGTGECAFRQVEGFGGKTPAK
jgi:hypothetical protein